MEDVFAHVTMKTRLGADCRAIPQPEGRCAVKLSVATRRSNGVTIWHDVIWFTTTRDDSVIDRLLKGSLIFIQGELDEYNGKKCIRASQVSVLRDAVQRVEDHVYADEDLRTGQNFERGYNSGSGGEQWSDQDHSAVAQPRPVVRQVEQPRAPARPAPYQNHQRSVPAHAGAQRGVVQQASHQRSAAAPRAQTPRQAPKPVRVNSSPVF